MSASLVAAVSIGSMALYGAVALALRARARGRRPPAVAAASGLARNSPYFLWVPYAVIALRPGPEVAVPAVLAWPGLALVVAGPLVMMWSAATLGRHFDIEVQVHGAHEVVRRGPYRFVRHPIYSGMAAHFLGACLATGNLLLVLGTFFVTFPLLYQRASAEERLLRAELGDAYARYAGDVPMLVPFLGTRH